MKTIKTIEPEFKRAIYKLPERIYKRHWWRKKLVYPEGWYEEDSTTPAIFNGSTEFTVLDAQDPNLAYVYSFGFEIYSDNKTVKIRRFNFLDKI